MDFERFKRPSIPKIEAGKMTKVVRDVIKEVGTNKQNVYEKTSEDLKPLTEKFDKEIEEISKLREDVSNQVVPYTEQVQRLTDIPIHRTSNKYKKIGSGVVYYNNPVDLLDRLELLGGSILAGNNGVKNEFSQIGHTLNHLGVLKNTQLNSLLKKYVI